MLPRGVQEAVDPPVDEDGAGVLERIPAPSCQQNQAPVRPGRVQRPLDHPAGEGQVRHVVPYEADRVRRRAAQTAGDGVGAVVEPLDGGEHALARRLPDVGIRDVVDDERHGRLRHAGRARDIAHRRSPRPLSCHGRRISALAPPLAAPGPSGEPVPSPGKRTPAPETDPDGNQARSSLQGDETLPDTSALAGIPDLSPADRCTRKRGLMANSY